MSDNLEWNVTSIPAQSINGTVFSVTVPVSGPPVFSGTPFDGSVVVYANDNSMLFNSEDDISMNVKIDYSDIATIRSMMTFIYNEFGNVHSKVFNLNCFFYLGKDNEKMCFQHLKSLPVFRMSVPKHSSNSILFHSDWDGHPKVFEGWDMIEEQSLNGGAITHKVKNSFVIPDVSRISVYKWGFEITNESGSVQLIAIMAYALEAKFDAQLGKVGWKPPFKQELIEKEPDFMKPTAEWRKSNEG